MKEDDGSCQSLDSIKTLHRDICLGGAETRGLIDKHRNYGGMPGQLSAHDWPETISL